MNKFNVTYDIVSNESAENGEVEDLGFIAENVSLREGITLLGSDSLHVDGYNLDCQDFTITVKHSRDFLSGLFESKYLHIPRTATPSSLKRIHSLFNKR
jgi:hypothetical protein